MQGAAPRRGRVADPSREWPAHRRPVRRPRRRWRHRRAGERERFDAVRSEVGPAGQCVSSVLLASVVSFAPISGFRSGRHVTGQAGASHETKVVAALWTTLSVIPSEVEGSAPGRFCAFQRRNADLERRSRGKGRIALRGRMYLSARRGQSSKDLLRPGSSRGERGGHGGLLSRSGCLHRRSPPLHPQPKMILMIRREIVAPRLFSALSAPPRETPRKSKRRSVDSLRSLGMTVSLRSLGMAQS